MWRGEEEDERVGGVEVREKENYCAFVQNIVIHRLILRESFEHCDTSQVYMYGTVYMDMHAVLTRPVTISTRLAP